MLRRINNLILFKVLTLGLFSSYFLYTIIGGKVRLYLNPKLIPLLFLCAILFILIGLVLLGDIHKSTRKSKVNRSMMIFLFPIILVCIFPAKAISSDTKLAQINEGIIKKPSANISLKSDENHLIENDFVLQDGKIIPQESNFVKWEEEIYTNTKKYEGKTIEFRGFVYKEKTFRADEFVAGRSMMICCAADIQLVGYMCHYKNAENLQKNGWYNFTCKITEGTYKGEKIPLLEILNAKETEIPENEYVYP